MPSLTFVLPHWLYWAGLVAFPLMAMFVVRRQRRMAPPLVSLPLGYLMWAGGGFVGLHRFYLRNMLSGVVYIPLFLGILYANVQSRDARDAVSAARNDRLTAEFLVEQSAKSAAAGKARAATELEAARRSLAEVETKLSAATNRFDLWQNASLGLAVIVALMLLIDAVLLPGLVRRCREREQLRGGGRPERASGSAPEETVAGITGDPSLAVHTAVTGVIDRISGFVGEFVSYWSLIAVFVYYFEVIARYVFNSPTNWAHEAMFLMFGMQYLLSGAYALREDSHVRVDVIYMLLSERARVVTDIVTSVFFFIFTATLLVTGAIFAMDAINVMEVSFTEWAIQYWPVKITIALGAALILLQGIARLIKDVAFLRRAG